MICPSCANEVGQNDKFCQHCGTNLTVEKPIMKENVDTNNNLTCPNCNENVQSNDKFCINCGFKLNESMQYSSNETYNHSHQHIEREVANNTNITEEAKNLFNNTTKSIGRLAGNDEILKLNLRDMFAQVFKFHSKHESDDVFIAGTQSTTPHITEVSEEWGKPWVFSRVFISLLITFIGLWFLAKMFGNENSIPGMIFIGALIVPISGVIFFFESNAFRNISFFEVLKMFFVGGVFSLISTLVLYQFVSFSDDLEMYGIMTTGDAFLIGLVEEIGKAIIVVLFINYQRTNKILNGILIGASIGAGFAVFETAGYILKLSFMSDQTVDLNVMIEIIILRGWSALGGHLVWAAIIGAAVVIVKNTSQFTWSNILDKRFLFFFFISVVLHFIWDAPITFLGSYNLKLIILIVIAWIFIFILMKSGLTQVNVLQKEYIENKEKQ
ncbi:MAG: PrsW family glutamic-type intramembrane protease [Staphylococcus warneri]|nr:PrsW family glutamic-type intramembrane protease [Staphylococcus warneri]